jgi:phage-related tail protein
MLAKLTRRVMFAALHQPQEDDMAQNQKAVLAVPQFVKGPLSQVKKTVTKLEREVSSVSRVQRKQLDGLVARATRRADAAFTQLTGTLEALRGSALKVAGLASSEDVAKLTREVAKLGKRFDATVSKLSISKPA